MLKIKYAYNGDHLSRFQAIGSLASNVCAIQKSKNFDEFLPDLELTFRTMNFEAASFDRQPERKFEIIKNLYKKFVLISNPQLINCCLNLNPAHR
jgi:hypothetical protein